METVQHTALLDEHDGDGVPMGDQALAILLADRLEGNLHRTTAS